MSSRALQALSTLRGLTASAGPFDKEVEIDLNRTFQIDAKMRQAVKSIPGIIDVRDV